MKTTDIRLCLSHLKYTSEGWEGHIWYKWRKVFVSTYTRVRKKHQSCPKESWKTKINLFSFQLLLFSGSVVFSFCHPTDWSLPGSSARGILQARPLEWVAMPSSRGSSNPEIKPTSLTSPKLSGRFFTTSASWEALYGRTTEHIPDIDWTKFPSHLTRNSYSPHRAWLVCHHLCEAFQDSLLGGRISCYLMVLPTLSSHSYYAKLTFTEPHV